MIMKKKEKHVHIFPPFELIPKHETRSTGPGLHSIAAAVTEFTTRNFQQTIFTKDVGA